MESNREVFQEMREQEAFENHYMQNPQVQEEPEEKRRSIFDWCNDSDHKDKLIEEHKQDPILFGFNKRVDAHLGAIKHNSLKHLSDEQISNLDNKTVKEKWTPLSYHHNAKPQTAVQKLRYCPEYKSSKEPLEGYELKKFLRNERKKS